MTIGRIPSVEGGIQPTIVDAKGDLIAGVAADSVNRLAVGTNGTVLTADSSTSTGLAWTGVNQMANPVINGGMDIWQRGTSISVSASSGVVYLADRWATSTAANQATTVSRQTISDSTNLPNIQYALRFQRNSGQTGTQAYGVLSPLESTNSIPFAGKTVTLSFYARAGANFSASSSLLNARLVSGTGTDQQPFSSYTGANAIVDSLVTLTTSWQRFAITGTVPTTATEMYVYFFSTPVGTASTNDWFEFTGVQLDVGTYTASTAPTFRRSGGTIQGELAACQRYYWRNTVGSAGSFPQYSRLASGSSNNTANKSVLMIPLKQTMRTGPTAVEYGGTFRMYDGAGDTGVTDLTLDSSNLNVVILTATTSTDIADYRPVYLYADNNSNTYLGFSAEL